MNVAQNWTLIGLVAALIVGLLAAIASAHVSLREQVSAGFKGVDARLDAQERVSATRFDGLDRRLDGLDRDVQALSDHVFRDR